MVLLPSEKMAFFCDNERLYINKLSKKLDDFDGFIKTIYSKRFSIQIKKGASEKIVKNCLVALKKFCDLRPLPNDYQFVSFFMCYIVFYFPIDFIGNSVKINRFVLDKNTINAYFGLTTALEILGFDSNKIQNTDPTFLSDTTKMLQSLTIDNIPQKVNFHVKNFELISDYYSFKSKCNF